MTVKPIPRFAAALSEHPLAAHAVGEVAGVILEAMDEAPIDLLVVFVDSVHTGAVDDISAALRELLSPTTMIGTTACGVLDRMTEVEDRSALSVWAASGVETAPMFFEPGAEAPVGGWSNVSEAHAIILADPFSSPVVELLESAKETVPQLAIHGGLASGARGPGGNRLLLDSRVLNNGAVGVALDGIAMRSVVSQGCRPVGEPLTVTGVAGNVVTELASQRPMDVLRKVADSSTEIERALMANGVQVGVVINEQQLDFTRGDFLIRALMGADPDTGAIAIGASVDVGTTLQFQVRDATTATDDLVEMLSGESAQAALTFTCNGRGERFFGRTGHDAELIHELTGSRATSGMFCAGEFGPVGARNHLHGFTASTLLFG